MMGPPPGGPGGPRGKNDKWKEPLPKNIREVPGYLKKVIGGTLHRMVYVFHVVWDTRHWILFVMMFMTLYDGVAPVIGSLITASLINALARAIQYRSMNGFFFLSVPAVRLSDCQQSGQKHIQHSEPHIR